MPGKIDLNTKRVQEILEYCDIPQNSVVSNLGGSVKTVYVRPTGSDDTGDGSLASPFATLTRALNSLSIAYIDGQVVIDITGCDINESLDFPPFITSIYSGENSGGNPLGPYGNTMEPRILIASHLVPDGNPASLPTVLVGNSPDVTTLGNFVTNATFTPDEHNFKFIKPCLTNNIADIDPAAPIGLCHHNTDTTVFNKIQQNFSANNIAFYKPGATINISQTNTLKISNVNGCIGFYGIEFKATGARNRDFDVRGTSKLTFDCCRFSMDSAMMSGGNSNIFVYYCLLNGSGALFENQGATLLLEGIVSKQSLFSGSHVDITYTSGESSSVFVQNCYTEDMGYIEDASPNIEVVLTYCVGGQLGLGSAKFAKLNCASFWHGGEVILGEGSQMNADNVTFGLLTIWAMSRVLIRNVGSTLGFTTFPVTVWDQNGIIPTAHLAQDMTSPFDFSIAAQGTFVWGTVFGA